MGLSWLKLGLTVLAVVFVAALVIGFINDPFGWRKAKEAEQKVVTAEAAAEVATATTQITDRFHTNTVFIEREAASAEASVRAVEGSEAELPVERVTALCEGLARVRGREACE